jgi:hypothetical protein
VESYPSTSGYVDLYGDLDFCTSALLPAAAHLLGEGVLGVILLFALAYLFTGLWVLSDIVTDAMQRITEHRTIDFSGK